MIICPPPPRPPPPLRPGPSWWRETGQIWQRQKSRLDKCERFSAGLLGPSSFPLCQQVEKRFRPYRVLGSGSEALVVVVVVVVGGGVNRCNCTNWEDHCSSSNRKIQAWSPFLLNLLLLAFFLSPSQSSAHRRSSLYYVA